MDDVYGRMALQPSGAKATTGDIVTVEVVVAERLVVAEDKAEVG